MSERLEKLQAMLDKQPRDTFLLYAIAMEHRKAGRQQPAIDFFDRVIALDSGYCYAYHQKGLALEALERADDARAAYRAGIEAARKKGDAHAAEEIAAALQMLD